MESRKLGSVVFFVLQYRFGRTRIYDTDTRCKNVDRLLGDISRERLTLVDYVEINVSLFPLRSFVEKENTYSKEYYDLSSEFLNKWILGRVGLSRNNFQRRVRLRKK